MSFADLIHCFTPYNQGELISRADIQKYLDSEEKTMEILKVTDLDGSGLIDFTEFKFFMFLYQIRSAPLRRMFKQNNGKMDLQCFSKGVLEI